MIWAASTARVNTSTGSIAVLSKRRGGFQGSCVFPTNHRSHSRAESRQRLFLAVVEPINLRPLRPRVVRGADQGRLRQDLELQETAAAVAHRGADAVGAGVAAADHDHVLVLRGDVLALAEKGVGS